MIRRIIEINEEKCNGCGACAEACHEGAIAMVNGKAKLMRDDYCDGLGDCLPACPTGAITFIEREAAEYDEAAVQAAKNAKKTEVGHGHGGGCPGSGVRAINHHSGGCPGSMAKALNHQDTPAQPVQTAAPAALESQLRQWPVQIKLAPVNAPWFDGAKLLIAADCTAYAYANFHQDFIKDHVTLVGCPKLDMVDYSEKLTQIIRNNDVKSVTVARMEVPCCGGIEMAVKRALMDSGKFIPWHVVTISIDGRIIDRN